MRPNLEYPLAYAHYRRLQDANLVEVGEPVISEGIEIKPFAGFRLPLMFAADTKCIGSFAAVRRMSEMGLHQKYSIAFPAIGVYEKDGLDPTKVYKVVKKYLENGKFDVDFMVDF